MLTALLLAKFATAAPTLIKVAELVNQPTIPTPRTSASACTCKYDSEISKTILNVDKLLSCCISIRE